MFLIFVVRNAILTVYSLNSAQLFAVSQAERLEPNATAKSLGEYSKSVGAHSQ